VKCRVGVDVGGSFTDFAVMVTDPPSLLTLKVLSRPDDPGAEIRQGLTMLEERHGVHPEQIEYFTHGTTVGVNTVIQRTGLKLALFTTRHFEDVLELARLKVPHIHNLFSLRPKPLVPRERVFGVIGRLDAHGREIEPLDEASVHEALESALAAGTQGVLISFLHSYRDGTHERRACAIVERLARGLPCFCASEIWPIIREFERTITGTISSYVQPAVAHYLDRFEQTLGQMSVSAPLRITKSNGGVMGSKQARAECVQMILSGTASGVIGAAYVAETAGFDMVLSLDVGGTSADVAIIVDGKPQYGVGERIGDFQIHIPSVSVTSIGQGGGSIARLDENGVLQVGPESAGSSPGPAGYARGGTRPTLTDAMAVCGLLGHAALGYGAVLFDRGLSIKAFRPLAKSLGVPVEDVAASVIELAVSGMYADTSALMSRFGVDPREFSLLAFGGAGPMLACFLARELNVPRIIIPFSPGVLSALGGLVADLKNDFISTVYAELDPAGLDGLARHYARLAQRARDWMRHDQGQEGDATLSCTIDMRYRGQSFEISTAVESEWIESQRLEVIRKAFEAEHERLYGHADGAAAVQIISLRVTIAAKVPRPPLSRLPAAERAEPVPTKTLLVWLDGAWQDAALFERKQLKSGHSFRGPAIITQDDCTTCVPAGHSVLVDQFGNLIITAPERNLGNT
jgi:N-methylhydantoinase A